MSLKAGLYIVSTPIGNLNDISLRAIDTLKNSTHIVCEDTRTANKLLAKYNINKPLIVYNDCSTKKTREYIKQLIDNNGIVSLISDAGTPLIADPGYKLVRLLQEQGYYIDAIPGACSLITALTLSGLPTNNFIFGGFLPKSITDRTKICMRYLSINSTIIFFETSKRLLSSFQIIFEVFSDTEICVARELTKYFQDVKRGKVSELIEYYKTKPSIKGEIVLLISNNNDRVITSEQLIQEIKKLSNNRYSKKDITQMLYSQYCGYYSKSEIYKMVNNIVN